MKQGVSFPTARDVASLSGGASSDAAYPMSNVLDLTQPRRVARFSGGALTFALSEPREIGFAALVHHTLAPGATATVSAGGASASATVPPSIGRPQVLPFLLEPTVASSITFQLPACDLGGVEFGGWWDWSDVMEDRDIGYSSSTVVSSMMGGIDHLTRQWNPTISSGNLAIRALDSLEGDLIDFQYEKGLSEPFVWCRDASDPATWARECVLVRNDSLPAAVASDVLSGQIAFALIEHL